MVTLLGSGTGGADGRSVEERRSEAAARECDVQESTEAGVVVSGEGSRATLKDCEMTDNGLSGLRAGEDDGARHSVDATNDAKKLRSPRSRAHSA